MSEDKSMESSALESKGETESMITANDKSNIGDTADQDVVMDDDIDDVDVDDEFNDNEEGVMDNNLFGNGNNNNNDVVTKDGADKNKEKDSNVNEKNLFELPEFTRKDKTLNEILEMMDDNPPLIPDAVIEYYMAKNGIECSDLRVKRLLALATQKFVSDIASDAYEYSRIRSPVAVNNANNGQARARQLMSAQQLTVNQQQQNEKNTQSKVTLSVTDLSLAVAEYGLNISRPDFYR